MYLVLQISMASEERQTRVRTKVDYKALHLGSDEDNEEDISPEYENDGGLSGGLVPKKKPRLDPAPSGIEIEIDEALGPKLDCDTSGIILFNYHDHTKCVYYLFSFK